jgi:16S rRNA (cytidine1402-2'-O)-methyltransferase
VTDPKLYIIATPLGNRGDITLRALEYLKSLRFFFTEDTREMRKLLELYSIDPSNKVIQSYAKHNMKEATDRAMTLMSEGNEIGFCCDRGTPSISDPGYILVRRAREEGFGVVPIPGASSVTAALSASALPCDRFVFLGFLPDTVSQRTALLKKAAELELTICLFESPRRVQETVTELKQLFPQGTLFSAREMTKVFEEMSVRPLSEIDPGSLVEKGEYVLAVHAGPQAAAPEAWHEEVLLRVSSDREWSKRVASRHGVSASVIYNALQHEKKERSPSL